MGTVHKKEGSNWQQTVLIVGALIVSVLFLYGYYTGTRRQAAEDSVFAGTIRKRLDIMRTRINDCNSKIAALKKNKEENVQNMNALSSESQKMQRDNDGLSEEVDQLHNKSVDCSMKAELQRASWTDEDKKNMQRLIRLHAQNRALNSANSQLVQTKGMRYQLAFHGIAKLKKEHEKLLKELDMEESTTPEYYEGLLKKWKEQKKIKPLLDTNRLLKTERERIQTKVAKRMKDATISEESIFIPTKNEDGTFTRPTWGSRKGNQPVTKGTFVNAKYGPSLRLVNAMQLMYPVALCAMNNNVQNFTFPTKFRRVGFGSPTSLAERAKQEVSHLHHYIDTPLVTFCRDCIPMIATREFRSMCGVELEVYGTENFWKMRSRIRFTPAMMTVAKQTYAKLGLEGKKYLSVMWKPQEMAAGECRQRIRDKPRRFFQWMQKMTNNKVNVVFRGDEVEDRIRQCKPTKEDVVKAIRIRLNKNPDLNAVYLSTDGHTSKDDIDYVVKTITEVPVVMIPSKFATTVKADVADIILSYRANELLANRYSIHSEVAAEFFMLRTFRKKTKFKEEIVFF